jgi:N-acetylglucosaminyldiphosphoundecaprenol N-acetyl-beta-D-mannosaminyltransferase
MAHSILNIGNNATSLRAIEVLGLPVACATYDSALEAMKGLAREPRATTVCPSNTSIFAEARHNPDFGKVVAQFDLVLPDGMPVVWALNRRGAGLTDRVYGVYLMRHVLCNAPRPWRHFLFGDTEDCQADLRRAAKRLQPDIDIVGGISPPFRSLTEADEATFAEVVNRAEPDFIWVALPGARAARWIIANRARYRRGVFVAIGDAFTLLSGRRRIAPMWMQRWGISWMMRLAREPARLGPRYLKYNSLFLFYLMWDSLRPRPPSPPRESTIR